MSSATQNAANKGDWRDGFLFVGNQLIVDFVNTLPVIDGRPVELLPDAGTLARWLVAAGLCAHSPAEAWKAVPSASQARDMKALRAFREVVRSELFSLENGSGVTADFVQILNEHLKRHPTVSCLAVEGGSIAKRRHFRPQRPADTFGPLAEDMAQVLTDRDPKRVRKCSSCAVHFVDTSKKGTRRWCSMAMCGNRSKVAAYARRA
jgi:predicted RNA-binding Zn ribbon-like protein